MTKWVYSHCHCTTGKTKLKWKKKQTQIKWMHYKSFTVAFLYRVPITFVFTPVFSSRVQIYKHAKYTSTFQWFSVRSVLLCLKFVVRCFYSLVHCASSNEFQWHFDFGHVTHDFDAQCTGRVCSKKWPQRVYGEHLRKVFFFRVNNKAINHDAYLTLWMLLR